MIDECTLSLSFESLPFFSFVFLRSVLPEKNNILKGKSAITASLMGFQFVKGDFSERLAEGRCCEVCPPGQEITKMTLWAFIRVLEVWGLGFGVFFLRRAVEKAPLVSFCQ